MRPKLVCEIAFSTNPRVTPTWTDVSPYLREIHIRRGRQRELDRVEAGTATIVLDDRDGRFDPDNMFSPYYPNVLPMRRIRVIARRQTLEGEPPRSTEWILFSGFIDAWETERSGGDAIAIVRATDGLKILAMHKVSGARPAERSDSRVNWLLDTAGWTLGQYWVLDISKLDTETKLAGSGDDSRLISVGQSNVQAVTLDDVPALQHLNDVLDAEQGRAFVRGDGVFVFQSRHDQIRYRADEGAVSFIPTYIDPEVVPAYTYESIKVSYHEDLLYTEVRLTRTGGTEQVASDTNASQQYFTRTLAKGGLLITTDVETLAAAQWLLGRYKDPQRRVDELVCALDFDALRANSEPANLLDLDLGRRANVITQRPGAGMVSYKCIIEGIAHDILRESWKMTFWMSPAPRYEYWTLGITALDSTARLAY